MCILLFTALKAFSQYDKLETATVNLSQPDHNGVNFPFDIAFYLDGDVAPDCFKIDLLYKINDNEKKKNKKWISFPPSKTPTVLFPAGSWTRINDAQKKFLLYCPGIHPNMLYTFEFTLYKNLTTGDTEKNALKAKIADVLRTFFSTHAGSPITPADITTLESSIDALIKRHLGINTTNKFLRQKSNPLLDYSFSVGSGSAQTAIAQVVAAYGNIDAANATLNDDNSNIPANPGLISNITTDFTADRINIITRIDDILGNTLNINKFSKELLTLPNTPALSEFRDYKLIDGLKVLRTLSLSPSHINMILNGGEKISNNTFVANPGRHYQSIYYLESLLTDLSDGIIRDVIPTNANHNVFDVFSPNLVSNFHQAANNYREIETAEKIIADLANKLPDLTTEVILVESQKADIVSFPDVVTEKTPYISAEGGIGYSVTLNTAYNYYGANFYFSPVNKRAPLSNLNWRYLIRKVICFNVGIGNFFGTRPENSYSLLGKSTSYDLLLGVGLRLGRVVKFNISGLPYKTNNTNPLSDKYKTKFDLAFSLGADVNLLKAFSKVAKALNLTD